MKKIAGASAKLRSYFFVMIFIMFGIHGSAQTIQTFTTSGSWTCPYGVTSVTVETWGGGGAGGGATNKAGGGGGGGAYSIATVSVTAGNSYNYIVGTGGVGVSGAAGPAGGASSFNTVSVANGGSGGGVGTTSDGAGGTGGAGTYAGGNGGTAIYATGSGGGGGGAGSGGAGGNGAALTAGTGTATGGGNGATGRSTNGAGAAGTTYGGGGAGAKNTGASTLGGIGANGQVKITYTVACLAPPAQPTALVLTAGNTSVAGSFTAAANTEGYLVVRTTTATPPTNPVDGTTYAAGSTALGGVVISSGATTSFNSTGLAANTLYYYWVYGYNFTCTAGTRKYLTTSPLNDNSYTACLTPSAQPTGFTLTPSAYTIAGSFSPTASADAYLVIRMTSATLPSNPVDGTTYTAGTNALGGYVESAGSATSFTSTGLTVSTQYWYTVFAYSYTTCAVVAYRTGSPLLKNTTTLTAPCTAPLNQPTSLDLTEFATSIQGNFIHDTTANGYLVIRTTTSAQPSNPVDGTSYTAGASALGGIVVYAGVDTFFTASSLTTNAHYWFWVYAYNSITCSGGIKYLVTSPLANNTYATNVKVIQTYGTSSTWFCPYGVTSIVVEAWGAGGAGGGSVSVNKGGGGGGGGAYKKENVNVVPGTTYNFTVGVGGTGSLGSGTDGGSSSFLNAIGLGGKGGGVANGANGTKGNGASGKHDGGDGANGSSSASGGGGGCGGSTNSGTNAGAPTAGTGGAAEGGNGGVGVTVGSNGNPGLFIGGGGSGGLSKNGTSYMGGNGANGQIRIKFTNPCDAPPVQATNLILTAYSNTVNGYFTPATFGDGYLVIRTTTSAEPAAPVNGTTYTVGTTALGGYVEAAGTATTFSSTYLNALTGYWYWVYAYHSTSCTGTITYNSVSPLTANTTTLACSSQTNSTTLPQSGTYNWSALTWSLGHVPTACENVVMTLTGTTAVNEIVTVNISSDVSIKNLSIINNSTAASNRKILKTYVASGVNLFVDGTFDITAPATRSDDSCKIFSLGTMTVTGNAVFGGASDAAYSVLSSYGSSANQTFIFKGNLTFNSKSYIVEEHTVIVMDGTGAQTITNNTATTPFTDAILFDILKIGNGSNTPTVTFAGTNPNAYMNDKGGYVDVTAGSTLVLPASYTLNAEAIVSAGVYNTTFYLRTGSTLKLGGGSGGQPGSNFPYHFSTYSIDANGTLEYNGSNAITQTVYNGVTYGNLVLTNGSGSGRSPKISTGALSVATVNINPLADFTLGGGITCSSTFDMTGSAGLYCGTNIISGTGSFNVGSGAFLGIGRASGITAGTSAGVIQLTGIRTYNSNATYTYNGSAAQATGDGLPSTVKDIIIDNPTTVTASGNITATGTTDLKQGIFDIASTKFKVTGTLSSTTGKMKANAGILEMAGTSGSAQTLSGSWFVGRNISTLVNSNTTGITLSATANDTLLVSSALLYGTGTTNSTITTNNNLTLLSRDSATARFGEIVTGSGNSITGTVNVERYVKSGRKWRLLSWPTTSTQTVKQTLMENSSANGNASPGYGMIVTDNASTWSTKGFDAQSVSGPSLKYWNTAINNWSGVGNTNTFQMNSQNAYFNYVRGDRSCLVSPVTVSPTIIRGKGTLKTGNQSFTIAASKTIPVGNPYASAVDLRLVDTANLISSFYLWDPNLTGTWGLGAYQTLYPSGTDYRIMPGGGSYGALNSIMNTLESGQAMFVTAKSSGTITFKESAKVKGVVTQARNPNYTSAVYAFLSLKDPGITTLADGAMTAFDNNYSINCDYDDIRKLGNTSENVSFKRNGQLMAIERRPHVQLDDTLFINLSGGRVHQYQWDVVLENMDEPGLTAFFKDNYLATQTPLTFGDTNRILVDLINNPGSLANNRFLIIFKQTATVLPVHFTAISATRNTDKTVTVKWDVQNELNMQNYAVEYSADGTHFNTIGTQLPTVNNGGNMSYSYVDGHATASNNYYRIRGNSVNGQVQYTAIAKVGPLSQTPSINIFPNPVINYTLNLRFENQPIGTYLVKVTNMIGQTLDTETIELKNSFTVQMINLEGNPAAGTYYISITDPDGKVTILPFIIK